MKHLSRPSKRLRFVALSAIAAGIIVLPAVGTAQAKKLIQLVEEHNPLLLHSSSQGYLGVDVSDVDQEKAQALKLKAVRGAVIILIDHDAPAGKIGLRVNDVVLALNGQAVEGADQLRRMLREIPAGHKVSILISRDGSQQTLGVELVDRRAMEQQVWNQLGNSGGALSGVPSMGILSNGDGSLPSSGFHMPGFGSSLNVGAMVEPLTSQMAEYLGVPSGLMVKQVARKSEAAAAGLKAFDVILKVGSDSIRTISDWDRSLRSNQGKPVQVTILRDRKQQTLTLQVDSKRHGASQPGTVLFSEDSSLMAQLDPEAFAPSREQIEEMREQTEKLIENFDAGQFKLDQKQLGELRTQMEQFRQEFRPMIPVVPEM